jgi:hypothetical protein
LIVLNLECSQQHAFEGWFASSDAFEQQCADGLVTCPVCGDTQVRRTPSAPYVRSSAPSPAPKNPQAGAARLAEFIEQLRHAASGAEDVGKAFADEARKIHYGDAPERSIRGQASREDVSELIDEGISVLPVPPAKDDLH